MSECINLWHINGWNNLIILVDRLIALLYTLHNSSEWVNAIHIILKGDGEQ